MAHHFAAHRAQVHVSRHKHRPLRCGAQTPVPRTRCEQRLALEATHGIVGEARAGRRQPVLNKTHERETDAAVGPALMMCLAEEAYRSATDALTPSNELLSV